LKKLSNKELKELSSPNYNNAQLLTYDNQKIYDNSIEKVLNLKNDQNLLDEKEPKKYASKDNHNININNKKSTEINFHTHYLNTEVYPINNRQKNKRDYYQYKILNKKSLKDNKITFNNILKSLQNKYNFKSKTPNRYTIKKKVTVKNNILSDSISKTKSKYCSQSPGIKKFGKINNDIHLKIEKNFHFPRQTNLPLTTHNNNNKNKNAFYLLNNNI
jgi:hypothetical protein